MNVDTREPLRYRCPCGARVATTRDGLQTCPACGRGPEVGR